jgi:FkbM family methyltransferase
VIYIKFLYKFFNFFKLSLRFIFLVFTYIDLFSIPKAFLSKFLNKPMNIKFKDGTKETLIPYLTLEGLKYKKELVDKEDNIFLFEINKRKFYGSYNSLILTDELLKDYKETYFEDYKNKKVLDVGGHVGDSAIYFLEEGAAFVDIYEPVKKNIKIMKLNLSQYPSSKYKINEFGVWHQDGEIEFDFYYSAGSGGFGIVKFPSFFKPPSQKIKLNCISFSKILKENTYDIAKIDCEGCELALVYTPDDLIKKVKVWIIETHNLEIEQKLLQKFKQMNYTSNLVKIVVDPSVKIYKFIQQKN